MNPGKPSANLGSLFEQLGELALDHPAFVSAILSVVQAAYRARKSDPWRAAVLRFLNKAAPYLGAAFANELMRLTKAGQLDIR